MTDGLQTEAAPRTRGSWPATARRHARAFPTQFWLLIGGTFVYFVGYDLCYPFESVYLHTHLGISTTTVGLIMGLSLFAGLPAQIIGGAVADRLGRRAVLILGICVSMALFEGLAFAHQLWQVILPIAVEAGFGWAMYLTATNAMLADFSSPQVRSEAYSISRVATNAGMVVGPLTGGALLAAGLSYRSLFISGGAICGLFLLIVVFRLVETKPAAAHPSTATPSTFGGYRVVLRDRRFLAFCAVTLLPLYAFGQFFVTLPVVLRSSPGTSVSAWGVLAAIYAGCGVLLQYPTMRRTKGRERMHVMAAICVVMGVGMAGAAYAPAGVPIAACVFFYSIGATLFTPITAAIVAGMAPVELRGRYMGAWTALWLAGLALGPTFGGLAVDRLGRHGAYAIIFAVCLAGAALYALLSRLARPVRGQTSGSS